MSSLYPCTRLGFFVLVVFCCLVLRPASVHAQLPRVVSVLLQASVSETPVPPVLLTWPPDAKSKGFEIGRKERGWSNFIPMEQLPGTATSWTDSTIEKGVSYEYSIINTITKDTTYGFGYVSAGIRVPVAPIRGQCMLLIDETMAGPLSAEIFTLSDDLINEGYVVTKVTTKRSENFDTAAIAANKKLIRAWYATLDGAPATIFIIGRVAVPYSGMVYAGQNQPGPDGHPEHSGAWAADTYYSCLIDDFMWKDAMTNTAGVYPNNKNLPGDGRWDNLMAPGNIDIRLGRVDLYNMGLFYRDSMTVGSKRVVDSITSERHLLKNYLLRDHAYRTGKVSMQWRGLIDDNFGGYGEQFARCAWMNYAPLLGRNKIDNVDYISTLDTTTYLWSYGCGGGGSDFQSAGGVGTSTNIAAKKLNTIFTMLFGSYFGDWDKANNLLRAPLAVSPGALTDIWAGRPYYFFHTMALGETIGDAMLLSQNNINAYVEGIYSRGVHMALMGDPTLRMLYGTVSPPTAVHVAQQWMPSAGVLVTWTAPDAAGIEGYYVYRTDPGGVMTVLNDGELVKDTRFFDKELFQGTVSYTVRSVGLLNSSSGSFFELSPAASASAQITSVDEMTSQDLNIRCTPNPAQNNVLVRCTLTQPSMLRIQVFTSDGSLVRTLEHAQHESGEVLVPWDLNNDNTQALSSGIYIIRVATEHTVSVQTVSVVR